MVFYFCSLNKVAKAKKLEEYIKPSEWLIENHKKQKLNYEEIPAATAMSHLAGSRIPGIGAWSLDDTTKVDDIIAAVSPYKISAGDLTVSRCSPTATSKMLAHFQPETFFLYSDDPQDYQQNEQIVFDQMHQDKLWGIHFENETKYPQRLVHHFLSHYQQGTSQKNTRRRFGVGFPPDQLPEDRVITLEMASYTLKRSYRNVEYGVEGERTRLLRSDSSPPRHVLLVAGTYAKIDAKNFPSQITLYYISVSDADDLISFLFRPSHNPDRRYPAISDYLQAEIRDIFNSPNWSA